MTALGGIASNGPSAAATGFNTLLVTPLIQPANGITTPNVLFPADANTSHDQAFTIAGSPFTSGASVSFQQKTSTPAVSAPDANGYYTWDFIAFQMMCPGWQALVSDGPGWDLIVANPAEPIVVAHAHAGANVPNLYMTGDITNGDTFQVPYWNGSPTGVEVQPVPLRYDAGGTNYFFAPATMPKLFEINQNFADINIYNPNSATGTINLYNGVTLTTTNGLFIKSNGTINNNAAFDSADANPVNVGSAVVTGNRFTANNTLFHPTPQFATSIGGVGSQTGPAAVIQEVMGASGTSYHANICCTPGDGGGADWIGFDTVTVGGLDADVTNSLSAGTHNSVFTDYGSFGLKAITSTANYTMTANDAIALMSGTSITNTLPDATSHAKTRIYQIKNENASPMSVNTTSAQTIDGFTNYVIPKIEAIGGSVRWHVNWQILDNPTPRDSGGRGRMSVQRAH